MASICDTAVCSPDDCNAHSMILQAGATSYFPFVFHSGTRVDIESTQPGMSIRTKYPHCFGVGETVHVIHEDSSNCNQSTGGCAVVSSVIDDYSFTVSGINTQAPGGSNGYVVRAMDLTGIRLEGSARTRPANQLISTAGIKASGFAGSKELLIDGTCDVSIGDLVSVDSIGLVNARVLAVYKNSSQTPTRGSVTSTRPASGCGCVIKPTTSNAIIGGACDSVLVLLDKSIPQQIINQVGVRIDGAKLFDIEFNYHNNDPRCGIVHSYISGLATRDLPVQTLKDACPDQAYKLGYFSICLKRGWGNRVPAHYPTANYDDQVLNVRTGELYVVPSYCT